MMPQHPKLFDGLTALQKMNRDGYLRQHATEAFRKYFEVKHGTD
jgi:hypothetical protein